MTEIPPTPAQTPPPAPISLAERLEQAALHVEKNQVNVGELLHELGKGSPYLVMALLAIPFAHPLPTWGLSMPFGLGIFLLAVAALRNEATHAKTLPEKLAAQPVSPKVAGVLRISATLSRFFERLMKPRMAWALWHPALALVAIGLSGLLLMLPLPIPFTNMASGLSATLISLAMLYRDGLAMLVASVVFVAMIGFFTFLGWGGWKVVQAAFGMVQGG